MGNNRLLFMVAIIPMLLFGSLAIVAPAEANNFCRKGEKITVRASNCARRETRVDPAIFGALGPQGAQGVQGVQGAQGIQGPQGNPGADGQIRIYGDGSAGPLNIAPNSFDILYSSVAVDGNLQFTDCTIGAGAQLNVPSGTVLRCSGTFNNNGLISVSRSSTTGGTGFLLAGGQTLVTYSVPPAGVSSYVANAGEIGNNAETRSGAIGTPGLGATNSRSVLRPGWIGGGGGSGSLGGDGGAGGGTFTVLAGGSILNSNTAEIRATGQNGGLGGGGGAGGIIILATPGALINNGLITVVGGNGGNSNANSGVGGGGGGAGGACAGHGGGGGDVSNVGTPGGASAGGAGQSYQTIADPTSLF